MMTTETDRIRKTVRLRAPLERVWRAISDSSQFGTWFGAEFDGPFVPGTRLSARIAPTQVDADVAKLQEPHAGTPFVIYVERVEEPRLLSFRWHPFGVDAAGGADTATLVEFELTAAPDGTQLTITESGFDRVPLEARARAFSANDAGWAHQANLITKYLAMDGGPRQER